MQLNIIPPVIAHRGASAYAPENTIAAFTRAAQLGIKWVEFDVMLAACDTTIVFHDETLDRTTNEKGGIGHHPYSYLQTLDAGRWFNTLFSGERIPALTDVLELLKNTQMNANIEIKPLPGQDKKTTLRVYEEVNSHFPQPNASILFSSFSVESLQVLRQHSSDCLIGLLLHDWISDWQAIAKDLECVSINVFDNIIDESMAKKIKNSGYKLLIYTVNDPKRADLLFSWGVDAVFSDEPDKILKGLGY